MHEEQASLQLSCLHEYCIRFEKCIIFMQQQHVQHP